MPVWAPDLHVHLERHGDLGTLRRDEAGVEVGVFTEDGRVR